MRVKAAATVLATLREEKQIKTAHGIPPKIFFYLIETSGMMDNWQQMNGNAKKFTNY